MQGIRIKAILIGVVVYLAANLVCGVALALVMGAGSFNSPEAVDALTDGVPFLLSHLVLGVFSLALASYAAAKYAEEQHYVRAAIVGVFALIIEINSSPDFPFWHNALTFISLFPAALAGGYLAVRASARA